MYKFYGYVSPVTIAKKRMASGERMLQTGENIVYNRTYKTSSKISSTFRANMYVLFSFMTRGLHWPTLLYKT